MQFRLGDSATCPECEKTFARAHGRQTFCTRKCAAAAKAKRTRTWVDKTEYNKEYREKHREKLVAHSREYYRTNREKLAAQQKAYVAALPIEVRRERRSRWEKQRQRRYHATRAFLPWLNAFRGSKARANKRKIPFTITKDWAAARWTGRCEVTGIAFVLSTGRNPYLFSPSLDRIIPSLGYAPENSRFVLHAVNALKGAGTDEDMLMIAKAIVQNAAPPMPNTHAPDTLLAVTVL